MRRALNAPGQAAANASLASSGWTFRRSVVLLIGRHKLQHSVGKTLLNARSL